MEERGSSLAADKPTDRKANAERTDDALEHDEYSCTSSVEIADEAEQEGQDGNHMQLKTEKSVGQMLLAKHLPQGKYVEETLV